MVILPHSEAVHYDPLGRLPSGPSQFGSGGEPSTGRSAGGGSEAGSDLSHGARTRGRARTSGVIGASSASISTSTEPSPVVKSAALGLFISVPPPCHWSSL